MLKKLQDEQLINLAFIGSRAKGVAHNMNTPLSAIMGRAEMLQMRIQRIKDRGDGTFDCVELDKCLKDAMLILENSTRISDIIKNIMQKSINAEADQKASLNLASVLKDELDFLMADMEFKHNIEKFFEIDAHLPLVHGSYVDFSNCFLEILDNAICSVQDQPVKRIAVSAHHTGSALVVTFNDTGKGFEPAVLESVQQRLRDPQAPHSDRSSRLAGLERAACLLKPYGAELSIESRPGDTTVTMHVPVP
ncbi:MAG: HAMP domain-containing histidine kinase [Deltaproteobacteria bacterium]|nr:HAMP domain-containing histidine kinase [Deltaproteobacteria bacterium]